MSGTLRWTFDAREGGKKRIRLAEEEVRGGGRYYNHSIQDTPRPGYLLQLHWEIPIVGGRRLARGVPQTPEGKTEVSTPV